MRPAGTSIKGKRTITFTHFFAMDQRRYTIVNMLRRMKLYSKITLNTLHQHIPNSKLYRGRPQMLVVKMSNGRNLQMFQNGTVQILGALSHSSAQSMRSELQRILRRIWKRENCLISHLSVDNIVISTQLNKDITFANIHASNHELSYEPEIFPAVLINHWLPVHVAVFHNGKVIITGLKSEIQADNILDSIFAYVHTQKLVK